ncbi:MAG: cytochrome c biogenesis protein CcsA [Phycisphaerae bacterium]|nr:cytochrome c biogenesis protein CcsA [Phycisphaerae bacterium]
MAAKLTIQGLLIYLTMLIYGAGLVSALTGRLRLANTCLKLGFGAAVMSTAYRWVDSGHVPLQNLFEVFLCLGMLAYPVSWLCRRVLGVDGGQAADMAIGMAVLFPAGFVFDGRTQPLPPALQSPLFVPHVALYMVSYMLMARAAFHAVGCLAGPARGEDLAAREQATYKMVCAGFPLLTAGLVLGSVWGQHAWGDWWGWDPKELWSLASWLVYAGYFHFRHLVGARPARTNSLWVIAGMIVILITLLWVNLSRLFPGLHSYAT